MENIALHSSTLCTTHKLIFIQRKSKAGSLSPELVSKTSSCSSSGCSEDEVTKNLHGHVFNMFPSS